MRSYSRAAAVAAGVFASSVAATFNAASSKNLAVYWGQGNAQITLSEICADDSVDIVNVAFVNGFPKKVGDYPATNFANACGDSYYDQPDGTKSGLLNSCPGIGPGIKVCHDNGKKVLLSIGGGWPTDYYLPSEEVAKYFAEFLWGAFGPQTDEWVAAGKPRPFGDVSVDGFDLDIESLMAKPPYPEYQYKYYDKFVTHLKDNLFPTGPDTYYISGAPQCVIPDVRLADAISKSHFDFIFAQFYNTPECSTRAGYQGLSASSTTFTFDGWVEWLKAHSKNAGVKLYLGMPAGEAGVPHDTPSYLTPKEANELISFYANKHSDIFGGVLLWEATVSSRNQICSKPYATYIKDILVGKFTTPVCASSSSSSSVASSTSSVASSTSNSAAPTATGGKSPDGTCGSEKGYTCIEYHMGECCSKWGFCGGSSEYCDAGCQSPFGKCNSASSSSSSASSTHASFSATSSAASSATSSAASSSIYSVSSSSSSAASSATSSAASSATSSAASSATSSAASSSVYSTSSSSSSYTFSSSSVVPSTVAVSSSYSVSSPSTGSSTVAVSSSSSSYASSTLSSSIVYPTGTSSSSVYPSSSPSSSVVYPSGSSSSSVVYPSGNTSSSVVYPSGTSSSSVVYPSGSSSSSVIYPSSSATSDVPYPTGGNSTSGIPYPTGESSASTRGTTDLSSSTEAYPTESSSAPCSTSSEVYATHSSSVEHSEYPISSSTPCSTCGAVYRTLSSSEGYPVHTESSSSVEYPASSTPCSTSGKVHTTSSSSGSYPVYPASSSEPYPVYPESSSKGYPVYPSSSKGHEDTPASKSSSEGYALYSTGPAVTSSKPSYPHETTATVTTVATTYVDICPTGLTTITTTITKTVCPKCDHPSSTDVPEGWYTTVTMCNHCGPKPTTLTLTKPADHKTEEYPAPTQPAYLEHPEVPVESAPAPKSSSPAYVPETPSNEEKPHPEEPHEGKPEYETPKEEKPDHETATSTVYQVITMIKVPVPASEYPVPATETPAPYVPANSTMAYAPTGTAGSTGSGSYPTYHPIPFEGGASRFGVGLSAVAVLVAGSLAL